MESEFSTVISKEFYLIITHYFSHSSLEFIHCRNRSLKTVFTIYTINLSPIVLLTTFIYNLLGSEVGQSFHRRIIDIKYLRAVSEAFLHIKRGSIINRKTYRRWQGIPIILYTDGWVRSDDTSGSQILWNETKSFALHRGHFWYLCTGSQRYDCESRSE